MTRRIESRRVAVAALAAAAWMAATATAGAGEPVTNGAKARTFTSIFSDVQVGVGLASAGPLRFRDTPDATIDDTEVFSYGAGLSVLFGDERVDLHRIGLGVSYDRVAKSADRKLSFITPHAAYEIGHPLVLHLDAGYAIASGTEGFKDNYSGWFGGFVLRYALRGADSHSPVSVSPGLVGRLIVTPDDSRFSSAFLGAQIEITYHSAH